MKVPNERFKKSRQDGRSDADVIIDMVKTLEPGTVIPFEQFITELSKDTARNFDIPAVRGVVCHSNTRLQKAINRTLHSIRGVGYRVAKADDHAIISARFKLGGDRKYKKGYEVLKHVEWGELSAAARAAHENQMIIMGALYQNQKAMNERMDRFETSLKQLMENGSAKSV